ncbi:MAG: LamG domain-containing protein [Pseudomonadota bacterium]
MRNQEDTANTLPCNSGIAPGIKALAGVLLGMALITAAGCKSVTPSNQPNTGGSSGGGGGFVYTGPTYDADAAVYKDTVWDEVRESNRCGGSGCHDQSHAVPFARTDNLNLARDAARTIVNLNDPAASQMVTKVEGGHHCWLGTSSASLSACANILSSLISAWAAGNSGSSGSTQITLRSVAGDVISDYKAFPNLDLSSPSTPFTPVHNLLTQYCADCHAASARTPQAPFFADSNINNAYEAAKPKMDLNDPASSRLVVRLLPAPLGESHNCWSDCAADAAEMQAAIESLADAATTVTVNGALVTSRALDLPNALAASGGTRDDSNVIAKYEFKEGSGNKIYDISGNGINLTLSGSEGTNYNWVGGWGVEFINGRAQASTANSKFLSDSIKATGQYSIEAWVVPANVTQEDRPIVNYAGSSTERNFSLGQTLYNYDFYNRTGNTGADGAPALSTPDAAEVLQASQQHVVVTYDYTNRRRIYVNGELVSESDPTPAASLTDWADNYAFMLANSPDGNMPWQGKIRFVAIHDHALTEAQIKQNFDAGVGEKYFLMFNVSAATGVDDSYVLFEGSQYDTYSYLFNRPLFVSLGSAQPSNLRLKSMRIGINGKESPVGQAYNNLDVIVDPMFFTDDPRFTNEVQVLSEIGTIIPLEQGPTLDQFFLTFDILGGSTYTRPAEPSGTPGTPVDLPATSAVALRTFEEVNATMSSLTGVSRTQTDVKATYDTVRQQLPTAENIDGFLAAHQMAVAQLAIEYCNALVDDSALRTSFFGSFAFDSGVSAAFGSGDSAQKNQIVDALYNKMLGLPDSSNVVLANMPLRSDVKRELIDPTNVRDSSEQTLFFKISNRRVDSTPDESCYNPDAACTKAIVKAMCTAVLGSAAILMQ